MLEQQGGSEYLSAPEKLAVSAGGEQVVAGAVAQLGEHLVCNQGVTGSIPVRST